MKEKHAGKTVSGTKILPMYKLEICDKDTVVIKTYQEKNQFISDVFVEDGLHLTDAGYTEMAAYLAPRIASLLR